MKTSKKLNGEATIFCPDFLPFFFFSGVHGPPWSIGHLIHHNPLVTSGYVLVDHFQCLKPLPEFRPLLEMVKGMPQAPALVRAGLQTTRPTRDFIRKDLPISTTSSGSQVICGIFFQVQLAVSVLGGVPGVRA